jgi:uracil-DNA glycosylase family 4
MGSEIFLVGQSLASRTQRRSGLPYFLPSGSLSPAGRQIDAFLGMFGYSIDPNTHLQYAYSSDIVQHYPGRRGRGDRKPTKAERDNCAVWLKKEVSLIQPRVIVLLGTVAARDFLRRYSKPPMVYRMEEVWGILHDCSVDGLAVVAVPLPHPSYRFQRDYVRQTYLKAGRTIADMLGSPASLRGTDSSLKAPAAFK